MARSILDIVIKLSKTGGADKETVKGLVQVKSAMMDAVAIAGQFVAAGYTIKKVYDETVGVMVNYADQVRSIQQVSRLSAEESSKLIQVTDDFKISQEDLLKVMQKNGDLYDYSISGLAAMSDEYLRLESAEKKAQFMQERFGKSWGNFVELMEQGSDKIVAAGNDINDALILDQKALDSAREYQKQLDALSDSWTAFKVAAGDDALPKVVSLLQDANSEIEEENGKLIQAEKGWRVLLGPIGAVWNAIDFFSNKNDEATVSLNNADAARMNGLASLYATRDATVDLAAAAKEASDANQQLLSLIGSLQSTEESYQERANSLAEERIRLEGEKKTLLAQGYSEQSEQVQDINTKLSENSQAAQDNAAEHELANKRIILSLLERKLTQDGILDDKELTWLLDKGVAWGIYSQTVVDEARDAMNEVNNLANSVNGIPSEKNISINVNTNYATAGIDQISSGDKRGRAYGGPVEAGKMYQVNEMGVPELLNMGDKQFLMMPQGGSGYVSPMGGRAGSGGAGGGVFVNVTINSLVNTADRERMKAELLPAIVDGVRSMQAQGMIR